MVPIVLKVNGVDALKNAMGDLAKRLPQVVIRGINRTVDHARTVVVRRLTEVLNTTRAAILAKRDKEAAVMSVHASKRDYTGRLLITGRRISLGKFKPSPASPSKRQRKLEGSSAQIYRSGGRKTYAHAFTAKMRSGHVGLFTRRGKKSLPIIELRGPSVPEVVENVQEIASKALSEAMAKDLDKNIQDQVFLITRGSP